MMEILTGDQLRALPTPRLLAYWKKHRQSGPPGWYWECAAGTVERKQAEAWDGYVALIKSVMDRREHVGPDRRTCKTKDPSLR